MNVTKQFCIQTSIYLLLTNSLFCSSDVDSEEYFECQDSEVHNVGDDPCIVHEKFIKDWPILVHSINQSVRNLESSQRRTNDRIQRLQAILDTCEQQYETNTLTKTRTDTNTLELETLKSKMLETRRTIEEVLHNSSATTIKLRSDIASSQDSLLNEISERFTCMTTDIDKKVRKIISSYQRGSEEKLAKLISDTTILRHILALPHDIGNTEKQIDFMENNKIVELNNEIEENTKSIHKLIKLIGDPTKLHEHKIFFDLTPDLPSAALTLVQMITEVASQVISMRETQEECVKNIMREDIQHLLGELQRHSESVGLTSEQVNTLVSVLGEISSEDVERLKNIDTAIYECITQKINSDEMYQRISMQLKTIVGMEVSHVIETLINRINACEAIVAPVTQLRLDIQSLVTNVASNASQLGTFSTMVSNLSTTIDSKESGILRQIDEIITNVTRIDTQISEQILALTNKVSTLAGGQSELASIPDHIALLRNEIKKLSNNLKQLTDTTICTIESSVQTLHRNLSFLQGNVTAFQTATATGTSALSAEIESLKGYIVANKSELSDINTRLNDNILHVNDLLSRFDTFESIDVVTQFSDIKSNLIKVEEFSKQLEQQLYEFNTNISERVSALEDNVSSRIDAIENSNTQASVVNNKRIESIKTSITEINSHITKLKKATEAKFSALDSVEIQVNALNTKFAVLDAADFTSQIRNVNAILNDRMTSINDAIRSIIKSSDDAISDRITEQSGRIAAIEGANYSVQIEQAVRLLSNKIQALSESVGANVTDVGGQWQTIASKLTEIENADYQAQLSKLQSDLADVETRLQSSSERLQNVETADFAKQINDMIGSIDEVTNLVKGIDARANTLEITSNTQYENLSSKIDAIEAANLKDQIDAIRTQLSVVESNSVDNETFDVSRTALKEQIDTLDVQFTTLSDTVDERFNTQNIRLNSIEKAGYQDQITHLEAALTTLNEKVAAIEDTNVNAHVASMNAQLTDAINRITVIEESYVTNQITTLDTQMTELYNSLIVRIAGHEDRINLIEASDYTSKIAKLSTSLNGRLTNLETANFGSQIHSIATRTTALENADFGGQINAAKTVTTNNTQRILTLENLVATQSLSSVQGAITTLTSQYDALQTESQNNSMSISVLGNALTSQQNVLVQNNNTLISVQTQIADLATRLSSLETELVAALRVIADATYKYGDYSLGRS